MRYQSRMQLTWLFATIAIAGCGRGSTPGLDSPTRLTLYSIDGRDFDPGQEPKTEERFHQYPVLGKVEITDAGKVREIVDTLKQGFARSDGMAAACFWPRHAIRVVEKERTIDYVICFECYQVAIHDGVDRRVKPVTREPQALLDKHLIEAGVPRAPDVVGQTKK